MPDGPHSNIAETVQKNAKRYIDVISEVVDEVMPKERRDVS